MAYQDYRTKIILLQGKFNVIKSYLTNQSNKKTNSFELIDLNYKIRLLHAEIELLIIDINSNTEKNDDSKNVTLEESKKYDYCSY